MPMFEFIQYAGLFLVCAIGVCLARVTVMWEKFSRKKGEPRPSFATRTAPGSDIACKFWRASFFRKMNGSYAITYHP